MRGKNKWVSRRQFLAGLGAVGAATVVAACQPKVVEVEKVVKETVMVEGTPQVVEKVVKETVVVEKQVTTVVKEASKATVVEFWHFRSDPMEGDAEHRMIELFDTSQDQYLIKEVVVPSSGIIDKFRAAVAGGNPPDVTDLWTWVIPSWSEADLLMPLDSYVERDIDWEDYLPITKVLASYKGHVWGMPWALNSWLLYYNKDVMKEAGLDAETPPLTTPDLDQYAEAMTKRDDKGSIERLGFAPWVPGDWIWTWGYVFGGNYYDPDTMKITADDPKIIESLKWKLSYADKFGIQNIADFTSAAMVGGSPGSAQAEGPTYTGKISMFYWGQWSLKAQTQYTKMDFDMTPLPYPEGGREKCTLTEGSPYLIPAGAKQPDGAWEFVKWTLTDPVGAMILATETGGATITNKKLFDGFVEKMEAGPRKNYRKFVEILDSPNVCIAPYLPVTSFYSDALNAAQESVLWGKQTPEEALAEVSKTVQAELDKTE